MRRVVIWLLAGSFSALLMAAAFLPAAWIAALLENRSGGRFALGDVQGTVWRGSAFAGAAAAAGEPVTPLLPGRFAWHLSPLLLLGLIDAELDNPDALSQPITITGTWNEWQVSPSAVVLPAERLAAVGAPLNTIQLSGWMRLSWGALLLTRTDDKMGLDGTMTLDMDQIASRLSAVRPLGAYRLTLEWHAQQARLVLASVKGPLLLSGSGSWSDGHLKFSGTARAVPEQEDSLAVLLGLLGQGHKEGNQNVIALELK